MARNPHARAVTFADDDLCMTLCHPQSAFGMSYLTPSKMMQIWPYNWKNANSTCREISRVNKHALQLIHGGPALSSMHPLIANVDNEVIHVDGIKCEGVPIGSPDFVQQFVATGADQIQDVAKVQVVSDSLTHFHLLLFSLVWHT